MAASVDRLAEGVGGLHRDVRRLRIRLTIGGGIVILLIVGLIGQVTFDTYQQRERSRQARDNARILRIVEDATTPGGQIYQRNQQGTSEAVHALLACGRAYLENATHGTPIPKECP